MTQDITPASSSATVEGYVRGYLYTASDGSTRVHQQAFATWLSEQFGYLTGAGSIETRMGKDIDALQIAAEFANSVGRENFVADPSYPAPAGNATDTATARLVELVKQADAEIASWETLYRNYQVALPTKGKALFNTLVAPGFPAGIELVEVTRAYVETFATDRGEESMPSPVSALVTLDQNDSATITGNAAPSGRHLTVRRLYRSATGTTSSAFRLQGEYPIAQTVIVDSKPDTQLNDVCPTFGWAEPPASLAGLVGMANGVHAGFVERTLYFSEPYKPYAYPVKYSKPLAHKIVGLAALEQSLFVGTTGFPYLVSGSDSASMSEQLVKYPVPCVAARSMVAIGSSVLYASPEGLALFEGGQVEVVSSGAFDRKSWQAYNPASMRAAAFDGRYVAFFTRLDATRGALMFDYKTRTICELAQGADAVFANESGLYVLDGTAVLDLLPVAGTNLTGNWHSKTFRAARPVGFAWLRVDCAGPATVRVYADGTLLCTVSVSDDTPARLPGGRYQDWRIEIDAAAQISSVVMAGTTEELQAAS